MRRLRGERLTLSLVLSRLLKEALRSLSVILRFGVQFVSVQERIGPAPDTGGQTWSAGIE